MKTTRTIKTVKVFLLSLLMFLPFAAQGQEKLFSKYDDMKEVESIYISKTMLEMNTNLFASELYLGKTKNLTSVRLLSTKDAKVRKEMLEDIRSLLDSSKYELLMKRKYENHGSEFYVSRRKDKIESLVMLMQNAGELQFVYLEGEMTEQDVRNILLYQRSSSIVIPHRGLENLQALQGSESLRDLQKYFDSDAWKQFKKQMKDWHTERAY